MNSIGNILVGLDLSEIDDTLVKFADFLAKTLSPTRVVFLNTIKNLNVPDEVLQEFPDLIDNAIAERESRLREIVGNQFTESSVEIEFVVRSGGGLKTFLEVTEEFEIDLIVIGNKNNKANSGILTQRLARRSDANLLVVPHAAEGLLKTSDEPRTILVPADFSDHSSAALERAIEIASNASTEVGITCQHVYQVPVGYHYSGKSFEEFAEIMRQNAEKDYQAFIKNIDKLGVTITPVYTHDRNDDLVKSIRDVAVQIKADGIVLGAKGIAATSSFFIGSIAEKLIRLVTDIPLLLVRKKGEQADIIDFLRKL